MTIPSSDSGGRGEDVSPDLLRSPVSIVSIANSTTVRCPICLGRDTAVVEGASRPATGKACLHCRGEGTVEVGWSSYVFTPRDAHLVWVRSVAQVNEPLVYWLCAPDEPVTVRLMAQTIEGLPCTPCMMRLDELSRQKRS
jgi:hypothetical protein